MKQLSTLIFLLLLISSTFSALVDAPFTVKEPLGFVRAKEPVVAGMVFPKGAVTDLRNLSLFRGTTEIPAQFDKLVKFEDGSFQWVLCSFTDDYSSKEEKAYTIKRTSPTINPATSIQLTRTGSVIHINNGVLSFDIDTVNFKGIKSVVYNSKKMIDSTGNGGITVRDEIYGQTTTNGPVSKAGFVYSGAMRATLRIEGIFYTDTSGGMGYSYMITVYAGVPRIKIELQVRNSLNALNGRMARIKKAFTSFPLAFTPTSTPQYDSTINYVYPYWSYTAKTTANWIKAYEHDGKGMAVTTNWSGGFHPFWAYRQVLNGTVLEAYMVRENSGGIGHRPDTVTAAANDSILLLMDLDVINQDIYLDFYEGTRTPAELGNLRLRQIEASIGRPDPAYLSTTGGISAGRFGTLADEEASYTKWGWTPAINLRPKSPAMPGLEKSYDDVHYET
ncbi:MAG: hypothetical protein JNL74_22230, partial [Fibrobacteres bacterium]|nr:hypothetical protein [Fibrobacterota bacterium]